MNAATIHECSVREVLFIHLNSDQSLEKLQELRDFYLDSIQKGVCILPAGASWELEMLSTVPTVNQLAKGQKDDGETSTLKSIGAKEKESILEKLQQYREKVGASSFACLAQKYGEGDRLFKEATLRELLVYRAKVPERIWIKLGKALEAEGI